jgi:hypothetical protein
LHYPADNDLNRLIHAPAPFVFSTRICLDNAASARLAALSHANCHLVTVTVSWRTIAGTAAECHARDHCWTGRAPLIWQVEKC